MVSKKYPFLAALVLALAPSAAAAQSSGPAATLATQAGSGTDTAAQPSAQGGTGSDVPAGAATYDPFAQPSSYVYVAPRHRGTRPIPYDGGAVPVGMRVETRRNIAPLVLGAVGFALTYVPSLVVASNLSGNTPATSCVGCGWLFVPVAGPFLALGYPINTEGRVALVLDGLFQAASVAALFIGFLDTHRVLAPDPAAPFGGGPGAGWSLLPGAPGTPVGASFSMTFF